ncbi:hypothetical protein GQ54DRAFT_255337 [Martensiomyces pterosporus]|nr:hypothetical protein GQ54DRAFT_255337 [Martensiomyces pterosporus]
MKNAYLRTAQQTARHSESAASAVASQPAGSSDVRGNERLSYLHTFDRILHTVLSAESYLFSEQEKETLLHFKDLDRHARYIFARLFMRKPAWIRVSSLNYGEQTEVAESCRILGERKQEGQEPFVLTESEIENCDEAISLLTVAELRALAKSRGIKQVSGKAKDALCAMIVRSAKQKTVLSFFQQNKAESSKQRTDVLVKAIVKLTGPMVKLNPLMVELFERLHLVFFRSPMLSPDDRTMKVAILATIGQIRFSNYKVVRSPDLFASREDVITYKRLLEVGNHMAELAMSPVKAVDHHRQGWEMFLSYRDAWKRHVESLRSLADARAATAAATLDGIEAGESSIAYWKRHFTPGWALARIVERGAKFASSLKQYQNEEDILLSLLAQKTYRLGKRGEWYERLVLLRTTHLKPKRAKGDEEAENKVRTLLLKARDACIRALDDKYVSRISLHSISRQLRSIESKLGIEESQLCEHPRMCLEWKEAPERTVYGVRIKNPSRRGPSLWDGDDEVPCSVEQLAIWRYRSLGYEGLHSENTIATTLFGLIFWDIIFHPLPGVLDTEYQSRPLDMGSESFCYSRQPLIDKRLQRVAAGDYAGAIQTVYDTEYGAECVGVSWEYTIDQLLTIAECIGGKGLATICKVLAKEYRLKSSGFPDLCLWNSTTKKVLFAEVKGPNDKLSEAQRDWIDILLSSGIDVELCLVREGDARDYRDQ